MMGRWVPPTPSGSDQKPFVDLVICESKKEQPLRGRYFLDLQITKSDMGRWVPLPPSGRADQTWI